MDDRRDDWSHGVDENLASLNAGQRVWEREMEIVRRLLGEFDHILRGDPVKETDGMISRLHLQENEVNLLKAVLLKDKAGNKGIVGRVEELESGDRRSDRWLKVWIAVIGLLSACLVAIASNLDRIDAFRHRKEKAPTAQRARRRHVTVLENPVRQQETEENTSGDSVP